MAERLKAHVLKTCLAQANVGSNPTPSAIRSSSDDSTTLAPARSAGERPVGESLREINWGGARVVDWGRLLSGYRGEILGRRFESCPPRHTSD